MSARHMKWVAAAAVLASNLTLHAQMAQDPLLSRTAAVEPNIVFIFDDSASMVSTAIYQYGGGAGYQGNRGPNDDAECLGVFTSGCVWNDPPTTLWGQSPDVNLIYYDPRVTYRRRVNADGSLMVAGTPTAGTSWNVYFYKPATVTTYSVSSISFGRGNGYPASGLSVSFPASPSGAAATATATVTTAPTNQVASVSVSSGSGGAYSINPNGQAVTFGLPATGGVRATGTANASSAPAGITNILNGTKTFSTSSTTPINCSVSFATTGGTGATASAVLPASTAPRGVAFTVLTPGTGYLSTTTASVTCGGVVQTGYAVTRATSYQITGVTLTNAGSGYSSAPSVTFPASTGSGTAASGSATLGATYYVSSMPMGTNGSGYTTCPAVTLTGNTTGGTGANPLSVCTSTSTGGVNKEWDGAGTPTTSANYFTSGTPAGYTPDAGSPLLSTATILPYPNLASSVTTNYPRFINRSDCGTSTCTWAQELQNYANWKLYHSTRIELAKTGVGLAFQPLNPTFRLGWGTLGQISGQGSTSSSCGGSGTPALASGVRLFSASTPADFLTWLYGINGNVLCTPSRYALDNVGKYYQRADNAGPWAKAPTGDGAIAAAGIDSSHATCRRSYSMLMTDGYYNDSFSMTPGDFDSIPGPNITQPRSYQYAPIGPFSDNVSSSTTYSNTLADVAMKYWVTDLRPDLNNSIKSVTTDDAYWQHMNFYAIGLGLVGSLDATSPAVLQSLSGNSPARTRSWPLSAGNDVYAIDDMWHATINGHGKMLNAKTAAQLNSSIQQMMSDISGKEGSQSGVAVSTVSLTKDTRKYTPSYTPITWTGNVTAYNLDQTTASQASIAWQVETLVSTDPITGVKTYSSKMPAAASRNIFVGNGNTTGTRAVPFTYAGMSAGMLATMGSTGINSALIDYLRGDPTSEDTDTTGSAPTGIYRARQTRLGDIVNSTPVFVKDSIDLGYGLASSTVPGQSSYGAFVTAKKARAEGALFVGANDGMLHAFRDGTYGANDVPIIPGGVEVFAYIPNALLPTLSKLSDKAYVHQYYVDGPNTETDAYLPTRGGWTNIVLGSTGAGAGAPSSAGLSPRSAVFAVDTTSLNTTVTGMDARSVLWEVGSNNSAFAELGYVLTDVQAGVTIGGQWIAVFGNGYESKSCQARLYVVNLETGALLREINTNAGSCATGSKNGLGGVRIVRNSSQQVVGVYAGDLLGNMWKFNLNNASVSNWSVDLAGAPLYTAGATKPITAAPTAIPLPMLGTTDPATGYMVVFGTGKFYEVPDITTTSVQTLYGVWDPLAFGASTIPAGTALTNSTLLVQQTISAPLVAVSGNTYFTISNNPVSYTGASPKRGWFIDMPNSGQRLVYPLDVLADRFIVADTISPSNVSLDPCLNQSGGTGYLYIVDALNGGGPTKPILDTNGDGNVDSSDMTVSGILGTADGRNVSIVVSKNTLATTYANVAGGAPGATLIQIACSLTNSCAVPLPGIRRQWRQLFLR